MSFRFRDVMVSLGVEDEKTGCGARSAGSTCGTPSTKCTGPKPRPDEKKRLARQAAELAALRLQMRELATIATP